MTLRNITETRRIQHALAYPPRRSLLTTLASPFLTDARDSRVYGIVSHRAFLNYEEFNKLRAKNGFPSLLAFSLRISVGIFLSEPRLDFRAVFKFSCSSGLRKLDLQKMENVFRIFLDGFRNFLSNLENRISIFYWDDRMLRIVFVYVVS